MKKYQRLFLSILLLFTLSFVLVPPLSVDAYILFEPQNTCQTGVGRDLRGGTEVFASPTSSTPLFIVGSLHAISVTACTSTMACGNIRTVAIIDGTIFLIPLGNGCVDTSRVLW